MSRVLRDAVTDAPPRLVGDASARDSEIRATIEAAAQEAYLRGRDEGFNAGYEAAAASLEHLTQSLGRSAVAGIAELQRWRAEDATDVVTLALAIAERVIGSEPRAGGVAVAERVREALAAIDDNPLTVMVHPDDADAVRGALRDVQMEVLADPSLEPGDAKVRGPWSEIELTTRTAWDAVSRALG